MPVKISYAGSKLIIPQIECSCGFEHATPDIDIYIGSGIISDCAVYIQARHFGPKALVVADSITYRLAGQRVEELLKKNGFQVSLCLLEREGELEPDEAALGEVLFALDKQTDFLVAVGSGSINDVTRYVAFQAGKPFVSVGTAASMDGYTSVVSPLLNCGLKANRPATYPKVLICDLEIMKEAPYAMTVSGFGDVYGKYIAVADWIMGRVINNEAYCPVCVDIVMQAVQKCVDNIENIRNRSAEGIQSLIEALILSGLTILIIGNTRPVASIEHNMAHYWEMMQLMRSKKAPSHGTAVGVGTGYAIKFFEAFLRLDLTQLDKGAARGKMLSNVAREKLIAEKYSPKIAQSIIRENPEDFIDWNEQERRIDAIIKNFALFKKELAFLPQWTDVQAIYKKLGAPFTAQEIGINRELLLDALLYAKDYRSRYTVFKSVAELGVLEELVEKIVY